VFCRSSLVPLSVFLWSLYCLSSSFGHCIVCLLPLVIVLSVFFLWSSYCLSSSFGHRIVCLLPLVIVLSVFFNLWLLIVPLVSSNLCHTKSLLSGSTCFHCKNYGPSLDINILAHLVQKLVWQYYHYRVFTESRIRKLFTLSLLLWNN
jgi:hypothetical protein